MDIKVTFQFYFYPLGIRKNEVMVCYSFQISEPKIMYGNECLVK